MLHMPALHSPVAPIAARILSSNAARARMPNVGIQNLQNFIPKGLVNNKSTLATNSTSHYLNQWWLIYRRIFASRGITE